MRIVIISALLVLGVGSIAAQQVVEEAPASFDTHTNGLVDEATHQADQAVFDEVEGPADGLGPLYNAQSCRECHQDPISGGASQVTELRVGHQDFLGRFVAPNIPIAGGTETIMARSLVNDRAICPNKDYPSYQIHEYTPDTENVRTTRMSLNLLGDGFIEAVADQTLIDLSRQQCRSTRGRVCGKALQVPVVEAPGTTAVGRFGWKAQHASLVSFSGDAYLNEMGITSTNFPTEVTRLCNPTGVTDPNDLPDSSGIDDVFLFARFIRATQAPARDQALAETDEAKRGAGLFVDIGCSTCHVPALTTAPTGTVILGGTFTIPQALGNKTFHPYSDFLLHDVGTGDGIVQTAQEHFGKQQFSAQTQALMLGFDITQNRLRTPPLWGVRLRTRLMHDGGSFTLTDAILRHWNEASSANVRFFQLSAIDRDAVIQFLKSL